jgi:hypothetical protein
MIKNYKQCLLHKQVVKDGKVVGIYSQIAYIPNNFAAKNKILELKENGKWQNGWKIISVFDFDDEEFVKASQRAHFDHRKVTDK